MQAGTTNIFNVFGMTSSIHEDESLPLSACMTSSLGDDTLCVCGVSLKSAQLITEFFPDCLKVMLFAFCFMLQGQ